MKTYSILTLCLGILLFSAGCSKEDPPVGPKSNGTIDATVYVAIGNSTTAGGQSGAVFESAQRYSLGNLIAQQLGTNFVQPLMADPGTGTLITLTSMNPVTLVTRSQTVTMPSNITYPAPYNNLGVYGCVMAQALDTSALATRPNQFFNLVMRDQAMFGKSLLEQALKLQPTFMTFWLGPNDALQYATTGGTKGTNLGVDGSTPFTLPTEVPVLQGALKKCLDIIKATYPNTKVVLGNIPAVTLLPFFTTIPIKIPNPLNPSQLLSIYFVDRSGATRAAAPGDYILLTAQAKLQTGQGLSPVAPLPSSDVLDIDEAAILNTAITNLNAAINVEAAAHGYPVADIFGFFTRVQASGGFTVGGETFTTEFIKGGLISLDGVHPSSKGTALVAMEFIRTMNATYGANISYPEIGLIPGIPVPPAPLKKGTLKYSLDWVIPSNLLDNLHSLND